MSLASSGLLDIVLIVAVKLELGNMLGVILLWLDYAVLA